MSNYTKLKTNLKLTIQRLKLLQKKKTELSHKSRKEIADYLTINKIDRAKIRVEHIIREDNYVEAIDLLESYCDLLLARFGLIEKMKELDPGLDEAISTIIWAAPRISNDIQEVKIISDILTSKYGKNYADSCKTDALKSVNEKVKKRLGIEPPQKRLVEQYLTEIAKNYNIAYCPDPGVMSTSSEVSDLINIFGAPNPNGGTGGNGGQPGSYAINNFDGLQQPGNYDVNASASQVIGFDNVIKTPTKQPIKSIIDSYVDSNMDPSVDLLMPVIPPPLPTTMPSGGDSNAKPADNLQTPYTFNSTNNSSTNSKSITPPPNYQNTLDYNKNGQYGTGKAPLSGPIVVSDANVPLPYKPGAYPNHESSPPPFYNEQPKYPNLNPTAPPRTAKPKDDFFDLPAVPNDAPLRVEPSDQQTNQDDDDDTNFDDLQKRFQNLKKL